MASRCTCGEVDVGSDGWLDILDDDTVHCFDGTPCFSAPDDPLYEYGVMLARDRSELHTGPMRRAEAERWVAEWKSMDVRPDAFVVVRRPVGEWEEVPGGKSVDTR